MKRLRGSRTRRQGRHRDRFEPRPGVGLRAGASRRRLPRDDLRTRRGPSERAAAELRSAAGAARPRPGGRRRRFDARGRRDRSSPARSSPSADSTSSSTTSAWRAGRASSTRPMRSGRKRSIRRCCRRFGRRGWRCRTCGVAAAASIVMIASIWGRESGGRMTYNAVKAAEISLAKSMAQQLARDNIRVNSVAPGSILFPGGSWHRRQQEDPAGIADFVGRELPFGRFGRPEEVGAVVAFLVSPRASWISGASVPVDGCQSRSLI